MSLMTPLYLAAKVSVEESFRIPNRYYEVNVEATKNLFSACVKQGVKKIVFASSAAVYGDSPEEVKSVGMEGRCESPYAENKLEIEEYSRAISNNKTEIICLRFFNVYGPGQKADSQYSSVIPLFIRAIAEGQLTIHGDGSQTRDFIHVADVCHSIVRVLESNHPSSGNKCRHRKRISMDLQTWLSSMRPQQEWGKKI